MRIAYGNNSFNIDDLLAKDDGITKWNPILRKSRSKCIVVAKNVNLFVSDMMTEIYFPKITISNTTS